MSDFLLKTSDQSPMAAMLRKAIGATADEDVQITTPTFERPRNWDPAMIPPTKQDNDMWWSFARLSHEELRAWGCRAFALFTSEPPLQGCCHADASFFPLEDNEQANATHELWLFPAEWYRDIPRGCPIVDINGVRESFEPGKTDDDRRFGLLAYGVMIPWSADQVGGVAHP